MKKETSDLQQELSDTADLDYFLQANREDFLLESVPEMLTRLLNRKGLSKAVLAKNSAMSEVYLHQVFSGRRNPSRSRLLCLCFGMGATLEETQELLRCSGFATLYPRNRRDAILIYGLLHQLTVFEVNDRLFEPGEDTLC